LRRLRALGGAAPPVAADVAFVKARDTAVQQAPPRRCPCRYNRGTGRKLRAGL